MDGGCERLRLGCCDGDDCCCCDGCWTLALPLRLHDAGFGLLYEMMKMMKQLVAAIGVCSIGAIVRLFRVPSRAVQLLAARQLKKRSFVLVGEPAIAAAAAERMSVMLATVLVWIVVVVLAARRPPIVVVALSLRLLTVAMIVRLRDFRLFGLELRFVGQTRRRRMMAVVLTLDSMGLDLVRSY